MKKEEHLSGNAIYCILNLDHYPENGKHLELLCYSSIPLKITKGEDSVINMKYKHLWAVYPNYNSSSGSFREFFWKHVRNNVKPDPGWENTKMFKTPEKAYQFAIKIYKEWLNDELKKLNE